MRARCRCAGRVCSWVVENLCPCSSPCAKRLSTPEDPHAWWRTFRFRFLQGVGCGAEHTLLVGETPPAVVVRRLKGAAGGGCKLLRLSLAASCV